MSEFTFPIKDALNGAGDFEPAIVTPIEETEVREPRLDPARGVFITSTGVEIQLADNPVNALVIQQLQNQGKPEIPLIEVTLLGKRKQVEPFVGHEGYQARLKEWETESQLNVLRYLFTVGVKGQPPESFVDEQVYFFPLATAQEMKYLWIASLVPTDDLPAFTEAITSRTLPTTKGLAESAESFRREG